MRKGRLGKRESQSQKPVRRKAELVPAGEAAFLSDVRELIANARDVTAAAVNSALVLLYWQVGTRIRSEVLKEARAEYGEEIVSTLSRQSIAAHASQPPPVSNTA